MNEVAFHGFLKKGGRSEVAIKRCIKFSNKLLQFLCDNSLGSVEQMDEEILQYYIQELESDPTYSANTDLWALIYLFDFLNIEHLKIKAKELREQRIKQTPFKLKDMMCINQGDIGRLAKLDINTSTQLLARCKTHIDRRALSQESSINPEDLLELVKLSDLARVGGIKSKRTRLYYDAGIQTPQDFMIWEPIQLREMLLKWVEETNFDGIAPLMKEIEHTLSIARNLPNIIEY